MGFPVKKDDNRLSLSDFLASKGIKKSGSYGDYQDYIEEKQTHIQPSLYREKEVPVRGSVHLALGRIFSKKAMQERWLDCADE